MFDVRGITNALETTRPSNYSTFICDFNAFYNWCIWSIKSEVSCIALFLNKGHFMNFSTSILFWKVATLTKIKYLQKHWWKAICLSKNMSSWAWGHTLVGKKVICPRWAITIWLDEQLQRIIITPLAKRTLKLSLTMMSLAKRKVKWNTNDYFVFIQLMIWYKSYVGKIDAFLIQVRSSQVQPG